MPEGQQGEGGPPQTPTAERHDPNRSLIPETAFESLRKVPLGEEPAYWPVRVLTELDYLTCGDIPNSPLTEQWAPFRQSMLRVKKAYEVLAYPHVKDHGHRYAISSELYRDYDHNQRDRIELNDAELFILKKVTVSANLPFDPQKRVYNYSDIPGIIPSNKLTTRIHPKSRMGTGDAG